MRELSLNSGLSAKSALARDLTFKLKLSEFRANRIAELVEQFGIFWMQAGRIPDEAALVTMTASIEAELPNWITKEILVEAVKAHRLHTKQTPGLANIVSEAKAIFESRAQPVQPTAVIPSSVERPDECWRELVSFRLLRRAHSFRSVTNHQDPNGAIDNGATAPSAWVVQMVQADPTPTEANAFCKMIAEQPNPSNRADLARYWGAKNAYGLSSADIRRHFPARMSNEERDFGGY